MTDFEWDEDKSDANVRRRGFGFEVAEGFEWSYALGPEIEYVDGEEREVWIGPAGYQLYVLVTTMRGKKVRVISMRVAENPDRKRWKRVFQGE